MSNTIFALARPTCDNSIRNVSARQTSFVSLLENLTSGKRVVRASDDPVSAAQAETRADPHQPHPDRAACPGKPAQRARCTGRNPPWATPSAPVQEARQLMVNASNGALSSNERATMPTSYRSLRDRLTAVASRTDTNGIPLLGALGSLAVAFMGPLS